MTGEEFLMVEVRADRFIKEVNDGSSSIYELGKLLGEIYTLGKLAGLQRAGEIHSEVTTSDGGEATLRGMTKAFNRHEA